MHLLNDILSKLGMGYVVEHQRAYKLSAGSADQIPARFTRRCDADQLPVLPLWCLQIKKCYYSFIKYMYELPQGDYYKGGSKSAIY